jgi:hypothetical protein
MFDKLITASRIAVDDDDTLDKEANLYNDIFDAFRLALKFYSFRGPCAKEKMVAAPIVKTSTN